jgi:hypothetical protein
VGCVAVTGTPGSIFHLRNPRNRAFSGLSVPRPAARDAFRARAKHWSTVVSHCSAAVASRASPPFEQRSMVMPERTEYAPGTPSWVDLQTSDQAAAKTFYGSLFGWTYKRPSRRRQR